MKTATTFAIMLVRLTGAIEIVLGLLLWTGNATNLVRVHVQVGVVLVLALWALAVLAGLAGVSRGLVVLALLWGAAVVIFGLRQAGFVTGPLHWIVEVLHFLVGLGAIGLAEMLAARSRRTQRLAARV
ncbi:MAG TPA: hypothetical protein VER55_09525 [Ardenticatenaceae bacterium]|nr:hypothetical protein [Ardenticatenaceae bacterium]